MKIDILTPDRSILKELGQRLGRVRKQQGWSQTDFAEEAGLGVATLRRMEAGQDSQMKSWLKIMKALGMTATIDTLLPERFDSPMAEALSDPRLRAKKSRTKGKPVMWGDEES